jgi:glycosyltransferase involved in cell wall biosynthesis
MRDLSELNICFIAGTLGQGGAERQLFHTLTALRQLGAGVTLLSLTRGEFWEDRLRACNIPVKWVGRQDHPLARVKQIIFELRRDTPDLIQSQHFYTNLYAVAAARALGRREIGALRSDTFSEVQAHAFAGRLSLRAPRIMVANSRAAMNNAMRLGVPAERLHYLPNVVDGELFHPLLHKEGETVKLLAAGRLSAEKRFDRFISLVSRLREKAAVKVKGVIAGDGPQGDSLRKLASEIGLGSEAIEFRGQEREMTGLYQEADILVLTSEFEGTPNVALEAMASGLPVVAVKVGGVPEIVENNMTGFLLEEYDELKMADLILRLINQPDLRYKLGRAARRFVESNHALSHLPRLLTDLYRTVLA